MQTLREPSGSMHPAGHVGRRLLRSTGLTFFASPIAFAVAGTCTWLLVNVVMGLLRAEATGTNWTMADVVSWVSLLVGLMFFACLAAGHITLMWIMGWRSGRQ